MTQKEKEIIEKLEAIKRGLETVRKFFEQRVEEVTG